MKTVTMEQLEFLNAVLDEIDGEDKMEENALDFFRQFVSSSAKALRATTGTPELIVTLKVIYESEEDEGEDDE